MPRSRNLNGSFNRFLWPDRSTRDDGSGSSTAVRPLTISGGFAAYSGPSRLYACCTFSSDRSAGSA